MPQNGFLLQRTCWSCDTNLFALPSLARSIAGGKLAKKQPELLDDAVMGIRAANRA
jgi:hypothetical protein